VWLGYTLDVSVAKPTSHPPLEAVPRARVLEHMQTPLNTMSVVQVGNRVDLDVEGATYATWHPDHVLTGYSWDGLALGGLLRASGPPSSVLILGLGGGTVARQLRTFHPQMRIVGIEIDPGVVDLARRYLHLPDDLEIHIADAYDWLARGDTRFDVVIDDLFLTGATDVVRSRVPEGDTLGLLRRRLAPGGVVVANLITDVGEHRDVRRRARAAFRAAFAVSRVVKPPRGLNEVLVGGDAVAGASALKPLAARLHHPDDLRLFHAVRVRSLPKAPPASTERPPPTNRARA
jgi:SAM-dependent methyltransferase